MSTDHASSLCPKLEGDFDYSEEIDADEESLPTKSIAYHQHNKLQGDDTHPIFLVRKPSQKRFSDFRSTSQGKGNLLVLA